MKTVLPAEKHGSIINAHLKSGALEISATDWMASPSFNPILGNRSAIFLIGGAYEELKAVFDKLSAWADQARFQDLHAMPFGIYGQFYDRYGIQWNFKGDGNIRLVVSGKTICPKGEPPSKNLLYYLFSTAFSFFLAGAFFALRPLSSAAKRSYAALPPSLSAHAFTLAMLIRLLRATNKACSKA
jgi:PhnB protein